MKYYLISCTNTWSGYSYFAFCQNIHLLLTRVNDHFHQSEHNGYPITHLGRVLYILACASSLFNISPQLECLLQLRVHQILVLVSGDVNIILQRWFYSSLTLWLFYLFKSSDILKTFPGCGYRNYAWTPSGKRAQDSMKRLWMQHYNLQQSDAEHTMFHSGI